MAGRTIIEQINLSHPAFAPTPDTLAAFAPTPDTLAAFAPAPNTLITSAPPPNTLINLMINRYIPTPVKPETSAMLKSGTRSIFIKSEKTGIP